MTMHIIRDKDGKYLGHATLKDNEVLTDEESEALRDYFLMLREKAGKDNCVKVLKT